MIKVYKIKVGEKLYEVEVQSVSQKEGSISSAAPVVKNAPITPSGSASPVKPAVLAKPAVAPVAAPVVQAQQTSGAGEVVEAPMQGLVVSVNVTVGQTVSAGDTLVVIEAMKMENPMVAPINGTVTSILVSKGDTVEGGDILVTIE